MRQRSPIAFAGFVLIVNLAYSDDLKFAWPPLPQSGFIRGRAATKAEFNSGVALFYLESNGKPDGKPLRIEIPQYAFLHDENLRRPVPVIVIPAESHGASKVVGCKGIADGRDHIVTLHELTLLGANVHNMPTPNNRIERTRER